MTQLLVKETERRVLKEKPKPLSDILEEEEEKAENDAEAQENTAD